MTDKDGLYGGEHFVGVRSGGYVNPFECTADEILWSDVAWHCGNLCRWTGASSEFFSVAQHQCLCVLIVDIVYPDMEPAVRQLLKMTVLVHDGGEYLTNDLNRPVKSHPDLRGYREVCKRVQNLIYDKAGIDHTDVTLMGCAKHVDNVAQITERNRFLTQREPWDNMPDPVKISINAWPPATAQYMYKKKLREFGLED